MTLTTVVTYGNLHIKKLIILLLILIRKYKHIQVIFVFFYKGLMQKIVTIGFPSVNKYP